MSTETLSPSTPPKKKVAFAESQTSRYFSGTEEYYNLKAMKWRSKEVNSLSTLEQKFPWRCQLRSHLFPLTLSCLPAPFFKAPNSVADK